MTIKLSAGVRAEVHFYQWNETPEELDLDSGKITVIELEFFSVYDAEAYLRSLSMEPYELAYLREQLFLEALALSPNISNDELIAQFATLLAQGLYRARVFSVAQYAYVDYEPPRPDSPPLPDTPAKPDRPPSPVENKAVLVEFIEVVERGGRTHVVTGAGKNSEYFQPAVDREDVIYDDAGTDYCKQFINISKDVDGADHRHPEYHRSITVKARVMLNGQPKAGESVVFTSIAEKGEFRPKLDAFSRESFDRATGPANHIATTGSDGWTPNVVFILSEYAGDAFNLFAKGPDGKTLKIGSYQVWRRFWYQITHFKDSPPPALTGAQNAYAAVFAEMVPTTIEELPFTEETAPKGIFYPGWMVHGGSSTKQVSVIGDHNDKAFLSHYKTEKNKPVKGHLVFSGDIRTPETEPVAAEHFAIHSNPSEVLTLNFAGAPYIVLLKPTLTGEPLVIEGKWSSGSRWGPLTDENILIELEPGGRNNLKRIRILLPSDAPDPTKSPVSVTLQLRAASARAGYSESANMVISMRGGSRTAENVNRTVTHEFGHGFKQPPLPGKQNLNLPPHPMQYIPQNSSGLHCRTGATPTHPKSQPKKLIYQGGTCVMFSGSSKGLFCATCHPYIRLEEMKKLVNHSE
jgi:hypothetical protein